MRCNPLAFATPLSLLAVAAATGLSLAVASGPASGDQAEVEKICAEAEARYQELFGAEPVPDDVVVVKMYKYTFCPPDLEVKAGTTLRWINVDKRTSHSVWFKEDGQEESERLFPDEFVELLMAEAGDFNYICGPHGEQEKMRAKISVVP